MANIYCGSNKYALVPTWTAKTYTIGDFIRATAPAVGNERVYRCTTGGASGGAEPTWITTIGATTNDGSAVWTEVTGNATYGWSSPHIRIANAVATGWVNAGDTVLVNNGHAYSVGAAINWSLSVATPAAPIKIICVDDSLALSTGAYEQPTGAFANQPASYGEGYIYGIEFKSSITNSPNANVSVGTSTVGGSSLVFENCKFTISPGAISSASIIKIGTQAVSSVKEQYFEFINCSIRFAVAGQGVYCMSSAKFVSDSAAGAFVDITTVTPTGGVFQPQPGATGQVEIEGLDLSNLTTNALIKCNLASRQIVLLKKCKLASNAAIIMGAQPSIAGNIVRVIASDSGSANYRDEKYIFTGTIKQETSKIRSGGNSDGTTPSSLSVASNANCNFVNKLDTDPIVIWNETVGTPITVTIEIAQDSAAANLKEGEIWLEAVYSPNASYTLQDKITDNNSTILTQSTTDQATSSVTWNNMTTPTKQKLSVTFTPQLKGYIVCKVILTKANTTVYVDPLITIS